jgi:uncharacterized protein (DUF58 family)
VVLTQRRVYILPTAHGILLGFALLLMLFGSINYSLALGFILTFLLAGMAIAAILHTYRNLAHLAIAPGRIDPAFAGGTLCFHLHLDNASPFDRIELHASCGSATDKIDVPARSSAVVTLALPAERRGWLRLPRIVVETRYPLGLWRAWSVLHSEVRGLVYPRPDESLLPAPTVVPERGETAHTGTGTDDFAGLRPYQPSDSPRHVAWKSVAREDVLLTKMFSGRGAAELWLDFASGPASDAVEARLSRLTRHVLDAEAAGVMYGLRLPGRELGLDRGERHCDACLKALALFNVSDK